jgi:hypothetical protein
MTMHCVQRFQHASILRTPGKSRRNAAGKVTLRRTRSRRVTAAEAREVSDSQSCPNRNTRALHIIVLLCKDKVDDTEQIQTPRYPHT